jgi:hypothetical protein
MSNVLVIFQADTEQTEQLALAVAVGAVEAEASIRLRRLAAPDAVEVAHKGYGKLQRADLLWANTIVVGLESASPKPELNDLLSLLKEIDPSELYGKKAWTFSPDSQVSDKPESQLVVDSALKAASLKIIHLDSLQTPIEGGLIQEMKLIGRKLTLNSF